MIFLQGYNSRTYALQLTTSQELKFRLAEHAKLTLFIFIETEHAQSVQITIIHDGFASESSVAVLQMLSGSADTQVTVTVEQQAAQTVHTFSHKAYIEDTSKTELHALIVLQKQAVQASAMQESFVLLSGTQASAHIVPALEIDNNQVTCKHASAITTFEQEHLVYAASRGISTQQAQQLLKQAFLDSFFEACPKENFTKGDTVIDV